ncbi:MAG: hypothetical protein OXG64_04140 [Chloroflexi bacterium]|nr:hypothetical protein [Chloroflexota bacterium]
MTLGGVEILGVVPRHRLRTLQQAPEAPTLTMRFGELRLESVDFATEVNDLGARGRQGVLGLGRRRDGAQSLIEASR